jgi:hypothetical protein
MHIHNHRIIAMKTLLIAIVAALVLIICSVPCFAQSPSVPSLKTYAHPLQSGQSFGDGSTVYVLELPGPGSFRDLEFSLCCGAPGYKGYLGNGFDYVGDDNGKFVLSFTEAASPCADGCKFEGNFIIFNPPSIIDQVCSEATGSLDGTLTINGVEYASTADYSQMLCGIDGVFWSSWGGLSVNW